jgi:hypothetical protein
VCNRLYFQKPIDHCIKFRKFYFCGAGCYIYQYLYGHICFCKCKLFPFFPPFVIVTYYSMVYWFLKIQRIISYHKSQNIEWLICWTFTKIRKILHPSGNNTPVTICRNQESGIEKSFRRKTPCTHYLRNTIFRKAPPSVVSGYGKRSINLNKVVATFEKHIFLSQTDLVGDKNLL